MKGSRVAAESLKGNLVIFEIDGRLTAEERLAEAGRS